ncbi:GGDEF domain-containing protein [Thermanaerovibrio velox]|uniref:GGDEF domain-containing protein n=1 Tax=Thermanaerovibrio velox TaxID=108007 RepID=UPI001FE03569|nr:GGDEF domain-containing protein [Thermanaerovibrio velox]
MILAFLMIQLAALGALLADLQRDRDIRDLGFLLGRVLQIFGWSMIFYRDVLPDGISVILGNSLMFAGICLDAATLVKLSRTPPRWYRRAVAAALAAFVGTVLLELPGVLQRERVMFICTLIHGGLMGLSSYMFFTAPKVSPLRMVLSASYGIAAAILFWRGWWLTGIGYYRLTDPSLPQVASILAAFGISTVSAISYGLLKKEWAIRQMRVLADQDGLTHLYNRRAFMRLGTEMFQRARSQGTPLWAMMIDIDHFKEINDTYGHSTGDEIISDLAFVMNKVLACHVTCRYGGEEFAALVLDPDASKARALAEALMAEVRRSSVMGISYTVSIGIAGMRGHKNLLGLINDADAAMYMAKRLGRNRIEVYRPGEPSADEDPMGDRKEREMEEALG